MQHGGVLDWILEQKGDVSGKTGKMWMKSVVYLIRTALALMSSVQFSSVTQSCLTLCDPMDHSTPGLPVHHQLLESNQTHLHWVGEAIQPSHPLSSLSPPAFKLSQHQGLFKWVSFSHQVAKVLSFSFNISPSNEHPGLISFKMDWLDLFAVQGTLRNHQKLVNTWRNTSDTISAKQISDFYVGNCIYIETIIYVF